MLAVEDESLASMPLENRLEELGCAALGPAARAAEALALAGQASAIDAALLDLDLGGERSHAVADALAARGVPFAIVGGHGPGAVPGGRRHAGPRCWPSRSGGPRSGPCWRGWPRAAEDLRFAVCLEAIWGGGAVRVEKPWVRRFQSH